VKKNSPHAIDDMLGFRFGYMWFYDLVNAPAMGAFFFEANGKRQTANELTV
jgi:hypothetical protein